MPCSLSPAVQLPGSELLVDIMDCRTLGFPVHHQLPELALPCDMQTAPHPLPLPPQPLDSAGARAPHCSPLLLQYYFAWLQLQQREFWESLTSKPWADVSTLRTLAALSNSMKLSHAHGATQDGRVMVERSDRMWSTGEGNGKPDRKSTRLNSSHKHRSRMPSSA